MRRDRITSDGVFAHGFVDRVVPGGDRLGGAPAANRAWSRLRDASGRARRVDVAWRVRRHRRWRLLGGSLSTGATIATTGVVIAGVAAAATLTTVFAPTKVAPIAVSTADVAGMVNLLGFNQLAGSGPGGSPSGSENLPYGTLHWSSSGRGKQVASLAEAEAVSGLTIALPSTLPGGVGSPTSYLVGGTVEAIFTFNANAGTALSGSVLHIGIGPAIAVDYANASTSQGLPTLAIAELQRPLVTSSGATTSQLEAFLLSRPGVPPALAQELRLLGDLRTTLPVPAPPGAAVTSTEVAGSPAVQLTDSSGAASVVIWEDAHGLVHVVGGLLDAGDVMSVANQIG